VYGKEKRKKKISIVGAVFPRAQKERDAETAEVRIAVARAKSMKNRSCGTKQARMTFREKEERSKRKFNRQDTSSQRCRKLRA